MDIREKLTVTQSFKELSQLAEHAEIKLSFFGHMYVSIAGYEGELGSDALAAKTMELLKRSKHEFGARERKPGKQLGSRIDALYRQDQDDRFSNANCFTKIVTTIRTFAGGIFNLIRAGHFVSSVEYEWHGLHDINNDFFFYTEKQLREERGISKEEAQRRGYFYNKKNGIDRWEPKFWNS